MGVFLFDKIIFGPVKSRRLGVSLGINLLPTENKYCNFDCIYCECGRTYKEEFAKGKLPTRTIIKERLIAVLKKMKDSGQQPDAMTFAGNGEPTIHPDFEGIIDDTIEVRDRFFPNCIIAVLSNATLINKPSVFRALNKVEQNILKLDSAFDKTIQLINNPPKGFTVEKLKKQLKSFNRNLTVQIMFVKGTYQEQVVNNSTSEEVAGLKAILDELKPKQVMIYTIERDTPSDGLQKVTKERLNEIAHSFRKSGHNVQISG
ncbi:MAG: radical SAM protein [Bacteroidota bacterium]|nr:radical SAM protein [Bacteroidota bacterium]